MADETEEKEATVTMVFPKKVKLQDKKGNIQTFEAGVHEVPESLADHWYLAANKVLRYGAAASEEEPAPVREPGEREVSFLQSKKYPVDTPDDVARFLSRLTPEDQAGFWKDADEWDIERTEELAKVAAEAKEAEEEEEEEGPEGDEPQAHRPSRPTHVPARRKVR